METSKESQEKTASEMAFRNEAIARLKSLAADNAQVKQYSNRAPTRTSNRRNIAGGISGLQSLRPSLGNQFYKKK
jgi:hypothetical protein